MVNSKYMKQNMIFEVKEVWHGLRISSNPKGIRELRSFFIFDKPKSEGEIMKAIKWMVFSLAMVAFLGSSPEAQAVTVIDFTAEAYRGGNTTGALATITENAAENGFSTVTTEAGQKTSYGTTYFNGWKLSDIEYLQFTFRNGSTTSPYSNLIITDGSGAFGVISSQGEYLSNVENHLGDTNPYYQATQTFYFAGKNGNSDNNYNFRFYEPAGTAIWTQGTPVTWGQIDDWYLLGVGQMRPLSSGEGTTPRAPLYTGLNIIWGDSAANYIGYRGVWDVNVQGIDGTNYQAGPVPEPTTMLLLVSGLIALAGARRRFKK